MGSIDEIDVPRLDILVLGPSQSGKSTLVRAFALDEEQTTESSPLHLQVGMNVTSQRFAFGQNSLQ